MSEVEALAFEKSNDFQTILKLRTYDEAAKVSDFPVAMLPVWPHYYPMIERLLTTKASEIKSYLLSQVQLAAYQNRSYLKISNLLQFANIAPESLKVWCEEVASWPKVENKWLSHWELNPVTQEKIMCRSENFLDYHAALSNLARAVILPVVSQLFGEPAALFKEKINYKLPGGAGFAAHQDSPSYIGLAEDHLSFMVAIDDATKENGCLQVCAGKWQKGQVKLNEVGVIIPEEEAQMQFEYVECQAGDVLFFSGYIPHRSEKNSSEKPRRAMYLTYNPAAQGDHRTAYYAAKHAKSHGFDAKNTLSFQGDFQGIVVD